MVKLPICGYMLIIHNLLKQVCIGKNSKAFVGHMYHASTSTIENFVSRLGINKTNI
jgi:hypothetical protein